MPQNHSDTAAKVAFESDIARALARRTSDMPLHAQVQPKPTDAEAGGKHVDPARDDETTKEPRP